MEYMRINKVEELVGITKKNIRFYEEKGLLNPARNIWMPLPTANGLRRVFLNIYQKELSLKASFSDLNTFSEKHFDQDHLT